MNSIKNINMFTNHNIYPFPSFFCYFLFALFPLLAAACSDSETPPNKIDSSTTHLIPCPRGCPRGQCDPNTNTCIDSPVCSQATEHKDCLLGKICYQGECLNSSALCRKLLCLRGVCDHNLRACANPQRCMSEKNCLKGYFCNEKHVCEPSSCLESSCAATGGACNRITGLCENPPQCSSNTDCLKQTHLCLQQPGDQAATCVENPEDGNLETLCQPSCLGSRRCVQDGVQLICSGGSTLTCKSAADCEGGARCLNGTCNNDVSGSSCAADPGEPNDLLGTATPVPLENGLATIHQATLCVNDVDHYSLNSRPFKAYGHGLFATLRLNPVDVGLAEVQLIVTQKVGSAFVEIASGSNLSNVKGHAEISDHIQLITPVGFEASQLFLTVRVKPLSTGAKVASPQLFPFSYDLSVASIPLTKQTECKNAKSLPFAQTLHGQVKLDPLRASFTHPSPCGVTDVTVVPEFWNLVVEEESYVTIEVKSLRQGAHEDGSPVVSGLVSGLMLRQNCYQDDLVQLGSKPLCSFGKRPSDWSTLKAPLQPGTYSVMVTASFMNAGSYEIRATKTPVACPVGASKCVTKNGTVGREYCSLDQLVADAWEACPNGCDASTGLCIPDLGTTCNRPFLVAKDHPLDQVIDLNHSRASVTLKPTDGLRVSTKCPFFAEKTAGKEVFLKIKLPKAHPVPHKAFVKVTKPTGFLTTADIALYATNSCDFSSGSCLASSDAGGEGATETITLENTDPDHEKEYLLVVDTPQLPQAPGVRIQAAVQPLACIPDTFRCDPSGHWSQSCRPDALEYHPALFCTAGCDTAAGPKQGQCHVAPGDIPGTLYTLLTRSDVQPQTSALLTSPQATLEDAHNSAPAPEKCPGLENLTKKGGRERFYPIRNVKKGDKITISLTDVEPGFDPILWEVAPYGSPSTICLQGVNANGPGGSEHLSFYAPEDRDYTFVVEEASPIPGVRGRFSLRATIDARTCTPGATGFHCLPTGIEYCAATGKSVTYPCACTANSSGGPGTPAADRCSTRTGNTPFDPLLLPIVRTPGAEVMNGTIQGRVDDVSAGNLNWFTLDRLKVGTCTLPPDSSGVRPQPTTNPERIYEVVLKQGETLQVDFTKTGQGVYPYILEDCVSPSSCVAGAKLGNQTISYTATTDKTVCLVVDGVTMDAQSTAYTATWNVTK